MTQDKKTEAREWWINETWLLGDPEMKNYFVEKTEPSAKFYNGAIKNYYHVVEMKAYQKLRDENEALKSALELAVNQRDAWLRELDKLEGSNLYDYRKLKADEALAKYPKSEK
jgi:hypothetical protein